MRVEVVLPKWGLTMSEATVVRWLCEEGDTIETGDVLVEVETEKANAEVPAPNGGTVVSRVAAVGTVVPVGHVLAVLETPVGADSAAAPSPTSPREQAVERDGPVAQIPARVPPMAMAGQEAGGRASPLARQIARELGVDVTSLRGTGRGGMVTEADVRAAAQGVGTGAEGLAADRTEKLAGIRMAIATAMSHSLAHSAQLTLIRETGMEGALSVREDVRDLDATLTDVLLAAVGSTLARHPRLNAHINGDEVHLFAEVNIGLAVALDDGLVTPVIRDVASPTLARIASERRRLVEAARTGALSQRDLEGGTFTVTNLGAYGIDAFTPIINPPEVAILGIGAVKIRPLMAGGGIVPSKQCTLSLTFDHRALDGAPAALFLAELAELLGDRRLLEERIR